MGRPSKLTDKQWEQIGKRVLNGEKARALAREFDISECAMRGKLSAQLETVKTVANQIVSTREQLEQMPVSAQVAAFTLADRLRSSSTHVAQQQETFHGFEQTIRNLEAGRAGDAARAERVRQQFAATAARDRAAARSDPAACERVADRSEVIGAAAAEGGGLLAEARRALERRDAEVSLRLGVTTTARCSRQPPGSPPSR